MSKQWSVLQYEKGCEIPLLYKKFPTVTIYQEGQGDVAYLQGALAPDEVLDNARLIAAAPDLLEACQTLVGLTDVENWQATLLDAAKKAHAAITKATVGEL